MSKKEWIREHKQMWESLSAIRELPKGDAIFILSSILNSLIRDKFRWTAKKLAGESSANPRS